MSIKLLKKHEKNVSSTRSSRAIFAVEARQPACHLCNTFLKTTSTACDSSASLLRGSSAGLRCWCDGGGHSPSRPVRGFKSNRAARMPQSETRSFGWFRGELREPSRVMTPGGDGTLPRHTNLEVTMKMVKSLLLGGAAGLVAVVGAQPADLPVKAKPVEYVKICSLYGEGFFYIPGTDTCLKIGGWVRYDQYFNQNSSDNPPIGGSAGLNTRAVSPDYTTRSRTVVSFDARSQTEYGTLRAYYRGGFELTTGLSSQYGNGTYYFERAFIQLGGWMFGRSQSYFDIFANQWGYGAAFLAAGSNSGAFGTNLASYTAQFGNGVSATLTIEDGNIRRSAIWGATSGPAVGRG